ncbi:hypothetical protein E2C01_046773 [Portunus trituberculatus]|uniref:Uncharacterized protein n=1 Tax=Portunus trituberculatus TaxID=210409 RepID=A0A5B7G6K9_PORTR|nr:hypothetical protein [Portunus trituberculatus]
MPPVHLLRALTLYPAELRAPRQVDLLPCLPPRNAIPVTVIVSLVLAAEGQGVAAHHGTWTSGNVISFLFGSDFTRTFLDRRRGHGKTYGLAAR